MSADPSWPPQLEGACYTREEGWFWPLRTPSGKIERQLIPDAEVREAGLPEHPDLPDGITTLILRSQPLQNLIPRTQP